VSSREAHAKQKALAQERKAAKPYADLIVRSKKIWERLRRKSHVPKEERDQLAKELFEIITGRVKDFVFKHDSVRVIQCALKYATPEQKKQIAAELQRSYRELAESKYAKFLIAKMVVGDDEIRDMVVSEFYGHVKRLIRHPEASWIMDDIYRSLATKQQKALLLREWYGPEFVLFRGDAQKTKGDEQVTAELSEIFQQNPAKRGPIMQHLKEMTNQLVQKKTTGFTMLHDALFQYFVNCKPGSPEATEFLEMLRDDEEGDCYKNLAFTKSGARLVCLALAYGSPKDRRTILKFFKTHIKLLASDVHGHLVLLAAYEVIDDTVMTAKAIFSELLSRDLDQEAREQDLIGQAEHLTARIPLLYLMAPDAPKWLMTEDGTRIVNEIREIRTTTSKKDPHTRRAELLTAMSPALLNLIATHARTLALSSFGCQFMTEVLLGGIGDKQAALEAVAAIANDDSSEVTAALNSAHVGRMLKALVQGGRYDRATKSIVTVEPRLKFHDLLYEQITRKGQDEIISWAQGPNSFVVLAMLEATDFTHHDTLFTYLSQHSAELQPTNNGAQIIIDKIRPAGEAKVSKDKEEKKDKKGKDKKDKDKKGKDKKDKDKDKKEKDQKNGGTSKSK